MKRKQRFVMASSGSWTRPHGWRLLNTLKLVIGSLFQKNNSSETNNSQDDSTGKQPPKTGDPTSFASLYALAGSALTGIGAVKLKFKKRK